MSTRAPAAPPELRGYGTLTCDAGEGVADFGGGVLEASGDLLGDIGKGAADLGEGWTAW